MSHSDSVDSKKGFAAGTLVHTDKGLIPIQQLKIGDRVLSMSEKGIGEKAYKDVVKTFKSEQEKPIMSPLNNIYCTDNHPFWVINKGGMAANQLDITEEVYWLSVDNFGFYDFPRYDIREVKHQYKDPCNLGGLYLCPTTRSLA